MMIIRGVPRVYSVYFNAQSVYLWRSRKYTYCDWIILTETELYQLKRVNMQ